MYTTNFAQVGQNIQAALSAKNMTQQKLADELGISKQVMSKIIKGSKAINVGELGRIAVVLETSTDDLLTCNDVPSDDLCFSFMGRITNDSTKAKVDILRTAIAEIRLLEELDNE